MPSLREHLIRIFRQISNADPILINAPGRVNLIGEHTDYNLGYVMPASIDRSILMAVALNTSGIIRLLSLDKSESCEILASGSFTKSELGWPNYILGVVEQMQRRGMPDIGFDMVFGGDLPVGAGMSSSAALVGGVAFFLNHLHQMELSRPELAVIAKAAENEFVGIGSGIMDQYASLNGREGNAILLDCRNLDTRYLPFPSEKWSVVLCDTNIRRELAFSEYNTRLNQCRTGVNVVKTAYPDVQSLRDVTMQMLSEFESRLDPVIFRRCRFVLEENERTLKAASALDQGDMTHFGQLMAASHAGLRDDYEVSCAELDVLADLAISIPGLAGARMMGGGFGGCTINIVENEHLASFSEKIAEAYRNKTGKLPAIHIARIASGTRILNA